jgi:hypothetical protein
MVGDPEVIVNTQAANGPVPDNALIGQKDSRRPIIQWLTAL